MLPRGLGLAAGLATLHNERLGATSGERPCCHWLSSQVKYCSQGWCKSSILIDGLAASNARATRRSVSSSHGSPQTDQLIDVGASTAAGAACCRGPDRTADSLPGRGKQPATTSAATAANNRWMRKKSRFIRQSTHYRVPMAQHWLSLYQRTAIDCTVAR